VARIGGKREHEQVDGQFRRNKTLSGVSSRRPQTEESPRHHVHHLTIRRRKVGGVFLASFFSVVVLGLLLTQFTAQVALVGTSSQTVQSIDAQKDAYKEVIQTYFGINPAERLRFLLNEVALTDYVSSFHPEVSRVEISQSTAMIETTFSIAFREPVAGWRIRDTQSYVDSQGVVFSKNYFGTPPVQIVDQSGINPEQGTPVASTRLLGFVGRVVALSKGRGYTAVEVILPADTTRRLDVKFKSVGPAVRFSVDRGAGEQVDDMVPSLQYISERGLKPSYVDVRVAGRTVYR